VRVAAGPGDALIEAQNLHRLEPAAALAAVFDGRMLLRFAFPPSFRQFFGSSVKSPLSDDRAPGLLVPV
jgi:hypothetical protein